jgi:hypothetical protein
LGILEASRKRAGLAFKSVVIRAKVVGRRFWWTVKSFFTTRNLAELVVLNKPEVETAIKMMETSAVS